MKTRAFSESGTGLGLSFAKAEHNHKREHRQVSNTDEALFTRTSRSKENSFGTSERNTRTCHYPLGRDAVNEDLLPGLNEFIALVPGQDYISIR
jgi:hypothetical protein